MIHINEVDEQKSFRLAAWIVLIAYVGIYSLFLLFTEFLPYVFDNNETFSSLIHAQNLYHFGIKENFGITDEAYGFLKSAHPFVYTHQGNFPRFYTFILYYLGARSPEVQIVITTFTIGLAGIWFCYYYLSKLVSPLLATIFCLLLMTDYIMFAQWQVNTWRVWHLFFFFSSFLCCQGLMGKHRKIFIILTILNFICLFYLELSFATFVFLSAATYLLILKKSWKHLLCNIILLGVGALIGVGILIAQDIAFLGWKKFLIDIYYTFSARNHFATNENYIKNVIDFYTTNKIVFWENFNSIAHLRNPILFMATFYRYCLLPYPQLLTLASLIIACSTILSYLKNTLFLSSKKIHFLSKAEQFIKYSIVFASLLSFFILLNTFFPISWGISTLIINVTKPFSLLSIVLIVLFVIYQANTIVKNENTKRASIHYTILISFLFLSTLISLGVFYLNIKLRPFSLNALQDITLTISGGAGTLPFMTAAILFIAASPLMDNSCLTLMKRFRAFLPFLIATLIGFMGAYLIFPGYIFSAYLARFCCFTIFAHMGLYAWTFYFLIKQMIDLLQTKLLLKNQNVDEVTFFSIYPVLKLITTIFLLMLFTYTWLFTQYFYVKEFPANNFSFINLLNGEPFKDQPLVVSTYAAPFSYIAQNWGYFDPLMGTTIPSKENQLKHDFRYLWFADANQNAAYQHPKFFICWQQPTFEQIGNGKSRCEHLNFIKDIRQNKSTTYIELEHDRSGRDQWSIVSLSGDYPRHPTLKWIVKWGLRHRLSNVLEHSKHYYKNYVAKNRDR